ncbi:flagellar basal body rod protein FlgC [Sutcliffiella rhizosphaerae]|uniref:Flagellar basal-body rod protein FlgC n=1 Tax=Sutcliffiella rhizosphaerae TaxID=2880967 RepID=A0ABM8YIZ6_9BACI|nr:flagellar basal body rod protein FlgC [Sutcliffiella rhizosphaerae]CAG9619715.1 Flagellar basal-body rod protein FlgC [Sutcliffiella rhizosphaerae]
MSMFKTMNISASALTSQRLRMDVISSNMANVDTTRGEYRNGQWEPYRRKMVETTPRANSFQSYLQKASGTSNGIGDGVKVTRITEDETPFRLAFDPEHPDADEEGYVRLPNVDPLKEMVDLMSATRSYEANVTVFNASKGLMMKTLELGK